MNSGPSLKLALIGRGAMGKLVEERARSGGHQVVLTIGKSDRLDSATLSERLASADVVIDFSTAEAVVENVRACLSARRPIVVGTTGWHERLDEVKSLIESAGGAMVYGANFSIGVNVFYRIVSHASSMLADVAGYEPFIEEQHHVRKKDAPSGTALKLKTIVNAAMKRDVPVSSTRAGHITGTHRVGFDSRVDQILLTHAARSREGFAEGAIVAAKWVIGKTGLFEFDEVMDSILTNKNARMS